jgi:hypothetical protein
LIIAMNLWILNTKYPLGQKQKRKRPYNTKNETHIQKTKKGITITIKRITQNKRKCFLTSYAGHYEQAEGNMPGRQ